MELDKIRVTIFIPIYQGESYLVDCIESALVQEYSKVVFLYGGGEDRSFDIANKYLDKGVEVIDTSNNRGMANNWNNAIKLVNTDFFCILHQDDLLHMNYAKNMVEYYNNLNSENCAMVYCDNYTINQEGNEILYFSDLVKRFFRKPVFDIDNNLKRLLTLPVITCPTILYKTNLIKHVGIFNPKYHDALDWEFQVRTVISGYSIHYFKTKLYYYRRHLNNETVKNRESLLRYKEILSVYKQLNKDHLPLLDRGLMSQSYLRRFVILLLIKDVIIDMVRMSPNYRVKINYMMEIYREK